MRLPFGMVTAIPVAAALLLGSAAVPASASTLFINATFTSNFVTQFGSNAAAAENAFNAAAAVFENTFSDPITINITVDAVAGTGTLGESNTPIGSMSWAALQAAFISDAKSATDFTAVSAGGSLFGADPTGGNGTWWITTAQEKALGIISGSNPTSNGTITVGAGNAYTFNESGGIAPNTFDLTSVFAHEISEVMGRIGLCGSTMGGHANSESAYDAFSYQGAGTRGLGGGSGNSFSVNAGSTLQKGFNNATANSGDCRDWASGTNDSFNAFTGTGTLNGVSGVDLLAMDALGYDPITAPEPSAMILLGSGLLLGVFIRRRAIRKHTPPETL